MQINILGFSVHKSIPLTFIATKGFFNLVNILGCSDKAMNTSC